MSKTNSANAVVWVNATAAKKMKLIVDIRFFRVSIIDEKNENVYKKTIHWYCQLWLWFSFRCQFCPLYKTPTKTVLIFAMLNYPKHMESSLLTAGGKISCLRCTAKSTRTKLQCGRPALKASKTQKCQFHGGSSTGPKTEQASRSTKPPWVRKQTSNCAMKCV